MPLLNSKISYSKTSVGTKESGVTAQEYEIHKFGRVIIVRLSFHLTSNKNNQDTIISGVPEAFRPNTTYYNVAYRGGGEKPIIIGIKADGNIIIGGGGAPAGQWYTGNIIAITNS